MFAEIMKSDPYLVQKHGVKGMKRGVRHVATHNFSDDGVRQIANMTDRNDHGGALLAGAKMLNRHDIAENVGKINAAHAKEGYLTTDLASQRDKAYDDMMDHARKTLNPKQLAAFNQAY